MSLPSDSSRGLAGLPPIPTSHAEVVVEAGRNRGFAVTVRDVLVGGRDPDCELQVFDTQVSRRHFRILREDAAYILEDLASSNGTFVNYARVTRTKLFHRDIISCGDARMRFLCPSSPNPGKTAISFSTAPKGPDTDKLPAPLEEAVIELDPKLALQGPRAQELPPAELITAFNLVQDISRQGDAQTVFETLFRGLDEVIPSERVVVCRFHPQSGDVMPAMHRRSVADPPGVSILVDRERVVKCCRTGKGHAQRARTGSWHVTIPMEGREETHGALYFESNADFDARTRLPLVAAVCRQAGLVLEQCALLTTVRQQKLRLEEFAKKAQEATQVLDLTSLRPPEREGQAVQLERMEAVARLAAGVAHDFNNLLTSILGYCDLLQLELPEGHAVSDRVEEIRAAGLRASAVTQSLLAFSRRQRLQAMPLDLNALVRDQEAAVRRSLGDAIKLTCLLDPTLGKVSADRGQIERVLATLTTCARETMPGGGSLTVETANDEMRERDLPPPPEGLPGDTEPPRPFRPGPYVTLSVTDTGGGLDPTTQARVFEPFFSLKGTGRGSGLAMATVYGIVTQSGGFLRVHSLTGRGTTFTVCLPRLTEDAPESTTPIPALSVNAPTAVAKGKLGTVLLAEDDNNVRELVASVLRQHNYFVLVAHDGDEALEISKRYPETIDLLLTDVVMPHRKGDDLAVEVARQRPAIRVVFMSGYTDSHIIQAAAVANARAFLQKPFTRDKLVTTIKEVLLRSS